MTSPLKTIARFMSPISPTITAPKCRLPRMRGTTPNSRSSWLVSGPETWVTDRT
jgi:hypothetical protein